MRFVDVGAVELCNLLLGLLPCAHISHVGVGLLQHFLERVRVLDDEVELGIARYICQSVSIWPNPKRNQY